MTPTAATATPIMLRRIRLRWPRRRPRTGGSPRVLAVVRPRDRDHARRSPASPAPAGYLAAGADEVGFLADDDEVAVAVPVAGRPRPRRLALAAHATQVELLPGGFALSNRIAQPLLGRRVLPAARRRSAAAAAGRIAGRRRVRGAGVTAAASRRTPARPRHPASADTRPSAAAPVGRSDPPRDAPGLVDWLLVVLITLLAGWTAVLGIAFLPLYLGPVPLPISALLGVGGDDPRAAGLLPAHRFAGRRRCCRWWPGSGCRCGWC